MKTLSPHPTFKWLCALCLGVAAISWLLRPRPETAPASSAVAVVPASQLHGNVTVWSWNIAAKSLQQLIPGFEKRHPNVHVAVDMTGARMTTRLMLSLASGVGAPDVSQFELSDAPRYIATGKLADLTPVAAKYRSMFPAYLWDNCMMDGKVYAIPWDMGPCAVFYKRSLFAKYGVDPQRIETWDDYIEAGRTILRKSKGQTKMLPLGSNALNWMFQMLIQQTGGQVFDGQGRIAISSPASRRALDIMRRLRAAGICSDVPVFSQEYLASINADTIASYPAAVWMAGTMRDTARDYGNGDITWGVFRLPAVERGGKRVANVGGSVLVIPAQCANKEAAWAFIEFALCTREGQLAQYRNFNLFPGFLPALQHPGVDDPDPFFGGQRAGGVFATDVTQISRLNMTPQWSAAMGYVDQDLSHWAATGMHNEGFFENVERKLAKRLGVPVAPGNAGPRARR
ncbi:MAG TPA: sugar ABC transporter substrate-binding protein [Armatimonadota bacterium]|jgi:lactose/L-arabinose transport system substrate-binding protein